MPDENVVLFEDVYSESIKTKYPNRPKKYYAIDLLLRNPDGVSLYKIMEYINCNITAIYSTIKRIRLHNNKYYTVILFDKIAKIRISDNIPTNEDIQNNIEEMENYSIAPKRNYQTKFNQSKQVNNYNLLILLLKDNPKGITLQDMANELKTSHQTIYNMIHYLKKDKKFKIKSVNGKYVTTYIPDNIDIKPNKTLLNKHNHNHQSNSVISSFKEKQKALNISSEHIDKIRRLPNHERLDYYDMVRKSLYYQKSSIGLIDANEAIIELNNEVMKGLEQ